MGALCVRQGRTVVRAQCRKESSRSLSYLLMSFLCDYCSTDQKRCELLTFAPADLADYTILE